MTRWTERTRAALGSLKLRIVLGAITALAFGIGLTTLLFVQRTERDTQAAQHQVELGAAVRSAEVLSHRVIDRQRALRVVAARLDASTLADPARLRAFVEDQPVLLNLFTHVFVASADGRMLIHADDQGTRWPDVDLADRDYFRATLTQQRAIVSEPITGRVTTEPTVIFTMPVRDGNRVIGVLAGGLRLASRDLLADRIDPDGDPSNALRVVTDAQGRVLAHPDRSYLKQPLSNDPHFTLAYAEWRSRGSPVEPAGLDLSQPDAVITLGGVAAADWLVWRSLPRQQMLAPLHLARSQALVWALATIALASAALLALVWHLLRPLSQLEHRALRLFDPQQDPHEGWPDTGGEIGRLTDVLRHVGAERVALERMNNEVLRKLGSVMSAAPMGLAFMQAQRFELVSAEFGRLFGRTEAELLGQPARMLFASIDDHEALGQQMALAFAAGQPYVGEWLLQRADGHRFWARLRGRPVNVGDPDSGTIWTVNDISAQVAERERLEWSAHHDLLTGLANRKSLNARLARVFDALPRSMPAAVVMIDLDHFKPINDQHGHAAGDAMLKAVALAITARVRAGDLVVRLGGDEFALLLERCPHEVALRIAEAVHQSVTDLTLPWKGRLLHVGASLGLAMLTPDTLSPDEWLHAADSACYEAKAAGRGAIRAAARLDKPGVG